MESQNRARKLAATILLPLCICFLTIQTTSGLDTANASENAGKGTAYLLDKGNLYYAYLNYKAAVRCYVKVLTREPGNIYALFNMGVSYGELGDYQKAIETIDRSISLNPEYGKLLYGRGRVYLLSGDTERAMGDFHRAAELGSLDAQNYLEYLVELSDDR